MAGLLVMMFAATACGKDEPEGPQDPPNQEQQEPNEPEQPDEPKQPDEPATPNEPTVPEGDTSKYHIPEEDEFLGTWMVYWEKCEEWRCFYGKWTYMKTEITEESELNEDGWPYFLGFLHDAWDQNRMIWGSWPVRHYNEILDIIANEGDKTYGSLIIERGLLAGDAYRWIWEPNAGNNHHMMILKNGNNVAHRWEISQFDGESFTVSPPFNDDFPRPEEGATTYRWTRKYKKYTPNN